MHVYQKKSQSRVAYQPLVAIAASMHAAAKELDPNLPMWSKLEAQRTTKPAVMKASPASSSGGELREIRSDGTITDHELGHRGFHVGNKVVRIANDDEEADDDVYIIKKYDLAQQYVTLAKVSKDDPTQPAGAKGKKRKVKQAPATPPDLQLTRSDILNFCFCLGGCRQ